MADETPGTVECSMLDFGCHIDVFSDNLADFFNWCWTQVLDGCLAFLALIPVPDWMVSPTFTIPDGVLWFAQVLELPYGAAIMVSAWSIRFLIRRLPFVG